MAFIIGLAAIVAIAVAGKPNIIFVLTDDQDMNMGYVSQPKIVKILKEGGADLTFMAASTPVCCPSRSGIQTGRYIHNVVAKNNSIAGNCSGPLWREGAEKQNVATYMNAAGYKTHYSGKYLNTYGQKEDGGPGLVPPGWTDWQGLVGNSRYYGYSLSNNGVEEKHGSDPEADYLPKVLLRKAMAFLHNVTEAEDDAPFFMMIGTPSCHDPTEPAAEYAELLPNATAPRTPNYGNYSEGKHWFVAQQPAVSGHGRDYTPLEEAYNDLQYRRRALTLMSVDDIVGNITDFLTEKQLLDNTYIFYSSDHGYHLGQFEILKDKRQPYEEDIRIPGLARGPGIAPGTVISDPLTLIDFTPTFLDIAGVPIPDTMDGISMLPALHASKQKGRKPLRTDFLIEYHGEGQPSHTNNSLADCQFGDMFCSFVGPEMNRHPPSWNKDPVCSCQDSHNNTYWCVRTLDIDAGHNWLYCEFISGFVEFYDINQDPWQRINQASTADPAILAAQQERLAELRACKGPSCKTNSKPIGLQSDVKSK
eukprot:TRINITY_DN4477_c0_g1_i1.p1 TRINITY_DN4477_c0_g1~~TRINITY_DN4477_c0_g1_i1.p1  ORF type:complete len:541 (+),score=160.36 TRINITY_DN4477_c0_g1_i1:26-1624(+)